MLARLGEFPVGVFGADWTLLSWTPAWAVLLGDPSARTPVERNLARAVFAAGPSGLAAWPVLQDGDAMTPALVADLRTALVNYPGAIVQVGAVTCDCEVLTRSGPDTSIRSVSASRWTFSLAQARARGLLSVATTRLIPR